MEDDALFEKRLYELADTAFHKDIVTFTDFLTLHELNIFYQARKGPFPRTEVYGGYESAERQMVAFIPDALFYEWNYPYDILKIEPLHKKFSESLTHRDFLGAILNLGIERNVIGDILVMEQGAYVFCLDHMSAFIQEELTRIRHTSIRVTTVPEQEFDYVPKYEEIRGTVASIRLDSMLSLAFSASRSKLSELIKGGKVFVNGRLILSGSYEPKPGDRISVRGHGKFQFNETGKKSKKGRLYLTLHKYI